VQAASSKDERVEDVRQVAIDHHNDVVSIFENVYQQMERDRFSNAFTYGRHKIDVILDRELGRLPAGSSVLDIGCGTGVYLNRFAKLGFVPTGLEPAPSMLEVARRNNPSVRIEQGVATKLPFPDASFDAVTAIEVHRYLHLDDIRKSLKEAMRVLRPGGLVITTLVNRYALDGFYLVQHLRARKKGIEFDRKNPHCEFFTPHEAEDVLREAGATAVRTEARLFAPVRLAYKVDEALTARIAARIEKLDDRAHELLSWTKPFAGHLIAIGERPMAAAPGRP
jgi:ubiquinone/menaquinone biosynthesis C-methylase UbiE